ncbi:MAG: BamA/TamA family outer membrane protein, partial [Bacillota bacterium]
HAAGFIGNAYFSGILEYHVPVFKTPLWLIGFLDSGRMWYYTGAGEGSEWGSYNWQVDFGFGLAFYTPIGIPLRFDIARSITDYQGWKWAIYFGN